MSGTASRTASIQKAGDNYLNPWDILIDLSRQQLTMANESASAIFRGAEAMRKIQQSAAHEASVHHETAADQLHRPCQANDLLAIQSEVLRVDLQDAGQYWSKLTAAAMQTQLDIMTSMSRMIVRDPDSGLKSALEVFGAAIPPLATSFFALSPNGAYQQAS